MDVTKIIAELREELDRIDEAIVSLERLAYGRGRRRGRPPAWLAGERSRARVTPRMLKRLSPRDAKVIRLRFGIGCERRHTLEEIARELRLTRQRICQIEARALRRLG
jgi:hypothetical protein